MSSRAGETIQCHGLMKRLRSQEYPVCERAVGWWGGYRLKFSVGGDDYECDMPEGIRGTVHVMVTCVDGRVSVYLE